jgi:hypothetical protein
VLSIYQVKIAIRYRFSSMERSVIDCLPGCEDGPGGETEPVTVEDHMLPKFAETYGANDKEP